MANQVSAILKGEDYQHIFSWQFVLELIMPKKNVRSVKIEDPDAGSVDDVTIQYNEESSLPNRFYQVKYHVDHRSQYSAEMLIERQSQHSSLLQKFWQSWQILCTQVPKKECELYLVSTWGWDSNDKLKSYISGSDGRLIAQFLNESERSDIGKIRAKWQTHLGADDASFAAFISTLRFRHGYACWEEIKNHVAERMENRKLKSDNTALMVAAGIVREWIKSGQQEITRDVLEKALREHDLYLPPDAEQSITIYLTTIKEQQFEITPDHILDWRKYFAGSSDKRGHQLINSADWNNSLLPELERLAEQVNQQSSRLIRARGKARLSAWTAFGYCFPEVAGYTIEVEQQGKLWRTDATPNDKFVLTISSKDANPNGEIVDGTGKIVAVGISVTGSLDDDVRHHLETRTEKIASLLLIRPQNELGWECFKEAGDVVAFADKAKAMIRNFVKHWQATRLWLYYFGPLSGACFLGHRLNAVCREIQIMEDQQPGYAPSFLLQ